MNSAVREAMPVAHGLIGYGKVLAALTGRVEGGLFPVHGICADPILHFELAGAGLAPVDADRVHLVVLAQVNDDPLRMQRVFLVGEGFREVRIALPERLWITV